MHRTMVRTIITLALALLAIVPVHAQYTYSVVHAVTGTSSTTLAIANTSSHDGVVRFPSLVVSCSGACSILTYRGGTIATATLSATYPSPTKDNIPTTILTSNLVKVFTAANSSGGTLIGRGDCSAACVWPITGQLPDRNNRHSMELARKTNSQYYVTVTGSSIDVVFSGVIEVVK